MQRSVRFSSMLLAAALSPALLQSGDCGGTIPTGDTTLALLELDVGGQNLILDFDTNDRGYDVWIPDTIGGATLTAVPTDPTAEVTWTLGEMSGSLGIGGGVVFISISPGPSTIFVFVRPSGGAVGNYMIDINPMCSSQGECDDGNQCTDDTACDLTTGSCPPPTLTPDGTMCILETGEDAFCNGAGECEPVGSQEWGNPRLLESNPRDAIHPDLAVDAAGNMIVVWQHEFSSGVNDFYDIYDIWASRYTPSDGWGEPELLETEFSNALFPQVAMDAAGNAIAVWQQSDGTRFNIWTNRYTPANGWGGAQLLETDDLGDAQFASQFGAYGVIGARNNIAMRPDGSAVVVWSQSEGPSDIQPDSFDRFGTVASHYTPGEGWSAPVVLDLTAENAGWIQVGLDANGNAIAVWEQNAIGNPSPGSGGTPPARLGYFANRYTPADGWGSVVQIGSGSVQGGSVPNLAVDDGGNAVAAWSLAPSGCCGAQTLWANRYAVGVGWEGAILVDEQTTDDGKPGVPHVVANGDGDIALVWTRRKYFSGGGQVWSSGVWAKRYSQGAWQPREAVLAGPAGESIVGLVFGDPIATMSPIGDIIVAWGAPWNRFDPDDGIFAGRFVSGVGWEPAMSIEDNGARGPGIFPSVTFAPDGGAMVAWADTDSSFDTNIWAVRFHP